METQTFELSLFIWVALCTIAFIFIVWLIIRYFKRNKLRYKNLP